MRVGIAARAAAVLFAVALSATQACAADPIAVRIGLASDSFATAAARLANVMGLYQKHGLAPQISNVDNSSTVGMALVAGAFDVAMVGSGELIAFQGRGIDAVALATLYAGSSGTVVLSSAVAKRLGVAVDAPAAQRLKALNGLTIASPSAVSSFTFSLVGAAKDAGAKPGLTYISQTAMGAALQTGAIDGFICSAPYWAPPVKAGYGVVWLRGTRGEFGPDNTLTAATFVQMLRVTARAHPEMVEKLRLVYADFARAVKERPQEVKDAMAKLYPNLDAASVDLLFDVESSGWMPPPLTPEAIAHDIRMIKATGANLPNIDRIDPAALINP